MNQFLIPSYKYEAYVVRVLSGDTVDLHVDMGCNLWRCGVRFGLWGVRESREEGQRPENALLDLIQDFKLPRSGRTDDKYLNLPKFILVTKKDHRDQYVRDQGILYGAYAGNVININERMVKDGWATEKIT